MILLTQAHHDHIGGLYDVIELLKSLGQEYSPKVFKKLDGN